MLCNSHISLQFSYQFAIFTSVCNSHFLVYSSYLCWECRIFECRKNGQIDRHVCVGRTCRQHVGRHVGDTTKNGFSQGTDNVVLTYRVWICWQHVGGKLAYRDLTLACLQHQYAITPLCQYASTPVHHYAITPLRHYTSTPVHQYASTPLCHYAISPLCQYVSTPVCHVT
jgi:hypothetical protein